MLHPVLESLFLLKVARGYVSESIMSSDIEEKQELVNYIHNEASDYEVMHLVVLGEMPEEKYDSIAEAGVWQLFKEFVIMNTETLKENMFEEDIMTIVYEMGPVSDFGYSSSAPILEFAKANGTLDNDYLLELQSRTKPTRSQKKEAGINSLQQKLRNAKQNDNTYNKDYGTDPDAGMTMLDKGKRWANNNPVKVAQAKNLGKGAAAGAAGVAGLFGLYKLYKYYKSKKDTKNMEKVQAKIKAKKAKA